MSKPNFKKLREQVEAHYKSNKDKSMRLNLIDKIDHLQTLYNKHGDKLSINQAVNIMDRISRKEFKELDVEIRKLEQLGRQDTKEFDLVRTIISIILLPVVIPVMLMQMITYSFMSYREMLAVQAALLATTFILTSSFLTPLAMVFTVPTTLVVGHFISQLFMNKLTDDILNSMFDVVSSLFFSDNREFRAHLDLIETGALDARKHVEGNDFIRGVKKAVSYFKDWVMRKKQVDTSGKDVDASAEPTPGSAPVL